MTCYCCGGPKPCHNHACPLRVPAADIPTAPAEVGPVAYSLRLDDVAAFARDLSALRDAVARLTSRLDLLEQRVLEIAAEGRRR